MSDIYTWNYVLYVLCHIWHTLKTLSSLFTLITDEEEITFAPTYRFERDRRDKYAYTKAKATGVSSCLLRCSFPSVAHVPSCINSKGKHSKYSLTKELWTQISNDPEHAFALSHLGQIAHVKLCRGSLKIHDKAPGWIQQDYL